METESSVTKSMSASMITGVVFISVKIPKAITRVAVRTDLNWTVTDTTASIRMNVYKTKEDAIINASTHWEGTSANATQVTLYPRTGGLANMELGVQKI